MHRQEPTAPARQDARLLCLAAALCVLAAAPPAFAAFDDIGVGARATGMGNAFVAIADDVDSIYYNPAGLGGLIGPEFTSSYSSLFGGLSDGSSIGQSYIAYAQPIKHGNWGTLGVAWNQLAVSGLYSEQTIYVSYGRVIMQSLGSGSLLGGITFKDLKQTVTVPGNGNGTTLANEPVGDNGAFLPGEFDPVLQSPSVSASGADIGLLYSFQRNYAVGLQVVNVMSPHLGGDSIPMGEKIGFAYRGVLTNMTVELDREEGSNSQIDNTIILGGERWLPTKGFGDFGLRAGFGVGDQSFEQLDLGASYRFSKLQLDYAFVLPLNSVTGTTGNQRFALSLLFGAHELSEETPGERAERELAGLSGEVAPLSVSEEIQVTKDKQEAAKLYSKAQDDIQNGDFQKATAALSQAIKLDPSIPGIGEYFRRLSFVSDSVPELGDLQIKAHSFIYNGILDLLAQKDDDAMRKIAYGVSLNPSDTQMSDFLDKLEKFTGIKAERAEGNLSLVDQKLTESLMAFKQGDYDKVIQLCGDVLALEPDNTTALNRLGSALYVTKDYAKAIDAWQRAYDLEGDENTKRLIQRYIDMAKQKAANQTAPPSGALQQGATQQAPAEQGAAQPAQTQPSTAPVQGAAPQQGATQQTNTPTP